MTRTTIVLPETLKARAMCRARRARMSFGELVRRSLEREVRESPEGKRGEDSFWSDASVYKGACPKDYSANVDKYLYDEKT
jgi:hypothetical protein